MLFTYLLFCFINFLIILSINIVKARKQEVNLDAGDITMYITAVVCSWMGTLIMFAIFIPYLCKHSNFTLTFGKKNK